MENSSFLIVTMAHDREVRFYVHHTYRKPFIINQSICYKNINITYYVKNLEQKIIYLKIFIYQIKLKIGL